MSNRSRSYASGDRSGVPDRALPVGPARAKDRTRPPLLLRPGDRVVLRRGQEESGDVIWEGAVEEVNPASGKLKVRRTGGPLGPTGILHFSKWGALVPAPGKPGLDVRLWPAAPPPP